MSYGDFSDSTVNSDLNYWFGGTLAPRPSSLYVGLSRVDAQIVSTQINEPVGGGYARVLANSWSAPTPRIRRNSAPIQFPTPTADWGTLRSWFISDALTGGNILASGQLTSPTSVVAAQLPVRFATEALVVAR
jgi:hypothetical protein